MSAAIRSEIFTPLTIGSGRAARSSRQIRHQKLFGCWQLSYSSAVCTQSYPQGRPLSTGRLMYNLNSKFVRLLYDAER